MDGIRVRDEDGEETTLLDTVGSLGYYPAVSDIIDDMGHKSIVHCHHLSMQK